MDRLEELLKLGQLKRKAKDKSCLESYHCSNNRFRGVKIKSEILQAKFT
jgi:hypothetical protein